MLLILAGALVVVGPVMVFHPRSGQGSSVISWEGWSANRFVIQERPIYIADSNFMATECRYRQFGPVRIVRYPTNQ